MPHFDVALISQSISVDRDRSTLSLFHLVDELAMPNDTQDPPKGQVHKVGPPFVVVVLWRRSDPSKPESAEGRLQFFGPKSRKPLGSGEFKIDLTGNVRRARAAMNIPFLPYQGAGEYRFDVELKTGNNWKRVGRRELNVSKLP